MCRDNVASKDDVRVGALRGKCTHTNGYVFSGRAHALHAARDCHLDSCPIKLRRHEWVEKSEMQEARRTL